MLLINPLIRLDPGKDTMPCQFLKKGISDLIFTSEHLFQEKERSFVIESFKTKCPELNIRFGIVHRVTSYPEATVEPIEGTRAVLIDSSVKYSRLKELCYELRVLGYKAIVTHPESNMFLPIHRLQMIRHEKALLMISLQHLRFSLKHLRKFLRAWTMVLTEMADLVSIDAKNSADTVRYVFARQLVSLFKGRKYAERLFSADPRSIL